MPAVLVLASVCVLAFASYAGLVVLGLATLLLQALVVGLWVRVTPMEDPRGTRLVAGAAALAADLGVLLAGTDPPTAAPLVPVLGLTVPAALLQQLARRDGRAGVVSSLSGTVSLATVAVLPAAVLAARATHEGVALVVCVVVAAGLVGAVPSGRLFGRVWAAALAAAVLAGAAVGFWLGRVADDFGAVRGAVLALLGGGLAVCVVMAAGYTLDGAGRPVAGRRGRRRRARRPRTAPEQEAFRAVLPLAVACPAAYLLGRLVVT